MDVSVGESIILPCQVTHDPLLDIMFTWYFNGVLTDFKKDGSHFEKVGGVSRDNLLMLFTRLWCFVPIETSGTYMLHQ